jgi:Tol biopolymer transport system component
MSSRSALLLLVVLAVPWWGCKGNINKNHPLIAITDIVSVTATGGQGHAASLAPAITPDGRYVVFVSGALEFLPAGTLPITPGYGKVQAYRKDLLTGDILLISQSTAGVLGNNDCAGPSISDNGRWIAFSSAADNLLGVGVDTNTVPDVFVRDVGTTLVSPSTIRVSVVTGSGAQGTATAVGNGSFDPVISGDGTTVSFTSDLQDIWTTPLVNIQNVFRHPNAPTGVTDLVSVSHTGVEANNLSGSTSISADGKTISFFSDATNLLATSTTSMIRHIYVRDMVGGVTELVSQSTAGAEGNKSDGDLSSVSADGTRVAFSSLADNLDVDVNPFSDIFLRIRGVSTSLLSRSSSGFQAFGDCLQPALSGDGRYVTFSSVASNLVSNDTNGKNDVFWVDTATGLLLRVSIGTDGSQANDDSASVSRPAITADGRFVVFDSRATNLIAVDDNSSVDVFIRGPLHP